MFSFYVHKENELDEVEARYPAPHYVMVDDKVRILTAIKQYRGERVTTVFPPPDTALVASFPKPDITLERIGDLQKYSVEEIFEAAKSALKGVQKSEVKLKELKTLFVILFSMFAAQLSREQPTTNSTFYVFKSDF